MLLCMAWPSSMIAFKLFLPFLLSLFLPARADIASDAAALLAFKGNVSNPANFPSWNASAVSSLCTWEGVTCSNESSSSHRVTALRLPGSALFGTIPLQTIGRLNALQILSLRKNKLSGSLPADLANCTALEQINLKNNSFSGPLPANFSAWPLLKKLDLSSNNFSGQIPSSLNYLSQLNSLFLEENEFSGSIPSLNVPPLRNFSVADNQLDGAIPVSLSTFTAESFAGNTELCGKPLQACASTVTPVGAPAPAPALTRTLTSSQSNSNKSNKLSTGAIVGIVIGATAIAGVAVVICVFLLGRKREKTGHTDNPYAVGRSEFEANNKGAALNKRRSGKSGESEVLSNNKLTFMGNAKQTFDLDDLLRASAEVLGKGSVGTSYKAVMNNGQILCVKRFREVVMGREETCKHIEMLGALQHPNLVPLRAYFFAPKGKLLVSDYLPNGSLSSLLHGNKGVVRHALDWESRLAVASGVAKGVVFLHSRKIVHGNIKSSNVVFDSDNEARLTDYSLVQLVPLSHEAGSTLKPNAFTPPEAREDRRKIKYKGDVYAFGVLLFELISGKSSIDSSDDLGQGGSSVDSLVQWVQSHHEQELEKVLDPLLVSICDDRTQDEMLSLLHIALPCVSLSHEKRPHMIELVTSIESLRKRKDFTDSTDFYFTQAV